MPQVQMPLFPSGTTLINEVLAYERREDQVVYYSGHLPVFTHQTKDLASFRLFTTQLIVNGTATQGQIVRAFEVPLPTVIKRGQPIGWFAMDAPFVALAPGLGFDFLQRCRLRLALWDVPNRTRAAIHCSGSVVSRPIHILQEDVLSPVAPAPEVVNRARILDAESAGHGRHADDLSPGAQRD